MGDEGAAHEAYAREKRERSGGRREEIGRCERRKRETWHKYAGVIRGEVKVGKGGLLHSRKSWRTKNQKSRVGREVKGKDQFKAGTRRE